MFSALIVLLMSGLSVQDASPQLSPRPLRPSGSHELQIPTFGAYGEAQCDDDSSMYFHLETVSYRRTVLLRISQSGNESTLYKLPDEFADTMSFTDFSVSPDGNVKALVSDREFQPIAFAFDSDGRVSSQVKLEVPEHVVGDHIAVFPNGSTLFAGHYRSDAPQDLRGKRYVGLFQDSGKLLKRLDSVNDDTQLQPDPARFREGGEIIGRDGNVYLLTSDQVVVISPSGGILRKISFAKPEAGYSAVRLQYSDGLLVISFAKPAKPEVMYRYSVLDALDGSPFGLYEPTEETGNSNVCFSRHDGFSFLPVKNGRVTLVIAPLR